MIVESIQSVMKKCPRCNTSKFYTLKTNQIRCKKCKLTRSFNKSKSKISPFWKGRLIEYFVLAVPAYRLRHIVPYSYKTILRYFRFIREAIYTDALNDLRQLNGIVELDETLFGGRRPGKRGWGASGKVMVFGIYKRNGKVLTFPVSSRKTKELLPLIQTHTRRNSLYYTDDWFAYVSLSLLGEHVVVKKSKGVPKGRDHINGIEGFWSYAKHFLYQNRGVSKEYFHLYLKEIEWRFNHRDEKLMPLVRLLIFKRTNKSFTI